MSSLPCSAQAYVDARGGQTKGTPLHLAAEGGHKHTVQLLIAERADMSIKDSHLRPPHLMAKDSATRAAFASPFVKSMCHGPSCTAVSPRCVRACLDRVRVRVSCTCVSRGLGGSSHSRVWWSWEGPTPHEAGTDLRVWGYQEGPGVLATPRADDACLFIIQVLNLR